MTDEQVVQILLDDFITRERLPLRGDLLNKYEDLFDVLPDLALRSIVAPWKAKFLMVLPAGLALATAAHRDRLVEWVDGTKEAFAQANRSDENKEWTIDELCRRTGLPPFAIKVALLYRARFLSGCLRVGFSDEDGFPVASRFGFEIRRPMQTLSE